MLSLTTPLGGDVLRPTSLSGREAISEPFSFELELRARNSAAVPFASLIGAPVTIGMTIPDAPRRNFNGIVSRISQGKRGQTETAYQMEVVPWLWFLTQTRRSRTFQQTSIPEILATVLAPVNPVINLAGNFQPRDYCVQYRESDFDFASRLMEEEGIFYFFQHTRTGHTMVITNSPDFEPSIPGASSVRFQASRPTTAEPRVFSWQKTQELRTGKYTLRDHNFQIPGGSGLEVSATTQTSVIAGQVTHQLALPANAGLETYDYPGRYAQRFDGIDPDGDPQADELAKVVPDGQRTVAIRMQEEAASSILINGSATARNLTAGHTFTLKGHFNANGKYLLTGVTHRAQEDDGAGEYSNGFTCIPAGLPYRPPRRTAQPVIAGTVSAVVVGPAGEEIYADKYGRVKVRFHWDRSSGNDNNSSCWVRVGPGAGAGLGNGFYSLPEVDDEVLVAFEHGDPDRPIIIGAVYNTVDLPPPPDPAGGG